jgi:hypothetical protein
VAEGGKRPGDVGQRLRQQQGGRGGSGHGCQLAPACHLGASGCGAVPSRARSGGPKR